MTEPQPSATLAASAVSPAGAAPSAQDRADDPPAAQRWRWYAALVAGLAVVSAPRFNRHDWFIDRFTTAGNPAREHLADAGYYMSHALYFRGEASAEALLPPFSYRPLVPWLAHWLPFDPLTAINLINMAALLLAAFCLYRIAEHLGYGFRTRMLAAWLMVFSFPTFYYGPVGLVEPPLLAALTAGVLLCLRKQWLAVAAIIALGTLVRETMIVFLPVAGFFVLADRKPLGWPKVVAIGVFYGGLYVGASAYARAISPTTPNFIWATSWDLLIEAITKPRVLISGGLSFGVPGLLTLALLTRLRRPEVRAEAARLFPLAAGLAAIFAMYISGMTLGGGAVDGRHLWISYAFTIPLGLLGLKALRARRATATLAKTQGAIPS